MLGTQKGSRPNGGGPCRCGRVHAEPDRVGPGGIDGRAHGGEWVAAGGRRLRRVAQAPSYCASQTDLVLASVT
jgi:hypothetical protein